MFGAIIAGCTLDILKEIKATVWSGVESADKVGKIVKTGIYVAPS
jgi:hypothetical protein